MSSDVLRESNLFQETVSDVSEYMFHEANNPVDSGYHSPQPMESMGLVSTNKVPCSFPKGGTLVDLPAREDKDEILSLVLCKDTGYPNVKFPVSPLTATPRVNRMKLTNASSIFAPLGKSHTIQLHYGSN